MAKSSTYDRTCVLCPRLNEYLVAMRQTYPEYHCAPVPAFGDAKARLLIVGLAPGLHGANATGRPFTGDHAGLLLYNTLYKYGFASQPESRHKRDGLKLINCRITNAVKCVPPQNKPIGSEINQCNNYLKHELKKLPKYGVILALGNIAHQSVLKALQLPASSAKFGHSQVHVLTHGHLIDSYHCSRYNTQTKRLTVTMFESVFKRIRKLLAITAS
jgi:uracil-DNA glycosylase